MLTLRLEAIVKMKKSEYFLSNRRGEMYERERFSTWPFFLSSSRIRLSEHFLTHLLCINKLCSFPFSCGSI